MRAIHRTPMRCVGHVGSARAAARALERVDFWQRRRACADALRQARPVIRAPLRDRGRRQRFLVEGRESGRRQAAVQHLPSQLVVSPQCEDDASCRAPVALARLGRPEHRLDGCGELYWHCSSYRGPRLASSQRFSLVSKGARNARALHNPSRHESTDYSSQIWIKRPALDARVFDGIEETGIDAFAVAVTDVFIDHFVT